MSEMIDHNTLSHLVEAGAIREAAAVAHGDSWSVVVHYGQVDKTLMATNSRAPRTFRTLETLVKYLLGLGIVSFETDARNFVPGQRSVKRPDKAAALKRAHAAAEHDKWFRAQVEASLADVRENPDNVYSHADVMAELQARIDAHRA